METAKMAIEGGSEESNSTFDQYTESGSVEAKSLVRKQDLRIIPLCAMVYLLNFLDRSNIGNAKILNSETGDDILQKTNTSSHQFNVALTVFYISYSLFEVPSNYLLKKLSPSRWVSFLMFAWGATTVGIGGVRNAASLTGVRFLLGVFEAGLYPGLVFYLTFWYRPEERSLRISCILASATLAGAFGGAIAYAVGHMNGINKLSGWQWLFILEGVPSCVAALVILLLLPDYPGSVRWLTDKEKELAIERLRFCGSSADDKNMTWVDAKSTLTEWRLYAHYLLYFLLSTPFSSLSLFAPTIVAGLGYKSLTAQLMTIPPYAVAYVACLIASWSADRFNSRSLHTAACALISAVGFIVSATISPEAYVARYICFVISTTCVFAQSPILLSFLASNTHTTASTGLAIALNLTFGGGPGLIIGAWIYPAGEAKNGFRSGNWVNAAFMFVISVVCVALRIYYGRANRLREHKRKFVL